eukprot:2639895-Pleurochrysis_carterae.AAC.1
MSSLFRRRSSSHSTSSRSHRIQARLKQRGEAWHTLPRGTPTVAKWYAHCRLAHPLPPGTSTAAWHTHCPWHLRVSRACGCELPTKRGALSL